MPHIDFLPPDRPMIEKMREAHKSLCKTAAKALERLNLPTMPVAIERGMNEKLGDFIRDATNGGDVLSGTHELNDDLARTLRAMAHDFINQLDKKGDALLDLGVERADVNARIADATSLIDRIDGQSDLFSGKDAAAGKDPEPGPDAPTEPTVYDMPSRWGIAGALPALVETGTIPNAPESFRDLSRDDVRAWASVGPWCFVAEKDEHGQPVLAIVLRDGALADTLAGDPTTFLEPASASRYVAWKNWKHYEPARALGAGRAVIDAVDAQLVDAAGAIDAMPDDAPVPTGDSLPDDADAASAAAVGAQARGGKKPRHGMKVER